MGRLVAAVGSFALVLGLVAVAAPVHAEATAGISGSAGQAGVTVTVYAVGSDDPTTTLTTQTGGAFSVTGMEPGGYQVRLSKRGYATSWYGGSGAAGESRGSATTLSLGDAETVDLGTTTLAAGGTIRGTLRVGGVGTSSVRYNVLKLVDGAWVREFVSTPGAASGYTSTNGAFSYQLSTLLPVKIYAFVGPSSGKQFAFYYGDAYSTATAAPLTVESGATLSGVDIDAPAVATLSGRLTNAFGGNLGGNATVHVRDHGQVVPLQYEGSSTFYTGPSTTFSAVVPSGTPVTYAGSSYAFDTTFLGDVADPEQATFRTVLPGGTLSGLSVALPGGRALRARLVESTWNGGRRLPAAGLDVTAWWNDTVMSHGTTDRYGYVRLPGLSWASSPSDIKIQVTGAGITPGWLRGFGEIVPDRAMGSAFMPYSDGDRDLGEYPVTFADGTLLTATSPMQAVNQVAGEPMTIRLPEWSTTPDEVTVTVDSGWDVVTITDDFSRVVEIPWYDSWDAGVAVTAVATKAGFQSGVATLGLARTPFRATQAPRITGTALPGETLGYEPAQFNAPPTGAQPSWQRDGGFALRGETYEVTGWDVGHTVRLTVDAHHGTAWAQARSESVRIQARSTLKASARTTRAGTRVAVTLATPGVLKPGGTIRVLDHGRLLAKMRVATAPATKAIVLRTRSRARLLDVVYSGATWAAPVERTVRNERGRT